MSSKPAVVLIHGAWHSAKCWDATISALRTSGYEAFAPSLPSLDFPNPVASHMDDVAAVRTVVEPLVAAGRDVVLVSHSAGGLIGSGAVEGLQKTAAGPGGGIIAAIFLAAFLVPKGGVLVGLFEEHPPYLDVHPENPAFVICKDAYHTFYKDSTPEEAAPWIEALRPHSGAVFRSPAQSCAWEHVPCTYVKCSRDNAVYPHLQQKMIDSVTPEAKYPLRVVELENDHSPWLGNVAGLVKEIVHAADEARARLGEP